VLNRFNISAQPISTVSISKNIPLPLNEKLGKQPGLAGAFAGCIGNKLFIAGGANFPDNLPWNGGKKTYWSDIYLYHISNDTTSYWEESRVTGKLPEAIAYGASVQWGDAIICIGGENENGASKKVYLITDKQNKEVVSVERLADLPIALTNLAATIVGNIVYVVGGENAEGVSDKLFKLDVSTYHNSWEELASLPVQASHGVFLTSQMGAIARIFFIGGRKKNSNGISDIYSSVFEYVAGQNKWMPKQDLPYKVAAGFGVSVNKNGLFYFGGDTGETFHKVELLLTAIARETNETVKQQLIKEKNMLQENHPGFSSQIMQYDVLKDKWKVVSKLNASMPVTTTIVRCHKKYYIPSGEIKAGIRSPQVLVIEKLK
jgi:cyclically-permuted mutarotase family protein